MIIRAARHVASPIALNFLIPDALLHQCSRRTTLCSGVPMDAQLSLRRLFAARTVVPSSTGPETPPSSSTPRTILTSSERKNHPDTPSTDGLAESQAELFNKALQHFHAALHGGKLAEASQSWSFLNERKLLAFYGPHNYGMSSNFVAACCKHATQASLSEDEARVLREVALFTAAGGATQALTTLMLQAIHNGEPRNALALYDEYLERLQDKGLLLEDEASGEVEEHDEAHTEPRSTRVVPPTFSPVRDEVLLSAIAAHASLETFDEALPMYLHASNRISQDSLIQFIRYVPASLRPRIQDYFRRLDTASFLARPEALRKHLANLTRDSAGGSMRRLYASVIEGMTGLNPWIAATSDQVSQMRPVALPDFFWSLFIKSFLAVRRRDDAAALWDDMTKVGVLPSVVTWNALLDGHAAMRSVSDVLRTWDIMIECGVRPDPLSYRALIHALNQAGNYVAAQQQLASFERDFLKPGIMNDPAVLVVYNTFIHDLLFASHEEPANVLLERMETEGIKPDVVTYNTFLRYYARKGNLKGISRILLKLESAGVQPDIFTFSTLLSAMLKVRPNADRMIINLMKKQGIAPDATALTTIIDQQLREGTSDNFRNAMDLLSKMERNQYEGVEPTAITYNSVLTSINRGMWLSRTVVAETNRRIWETMKDRSIIPNRSTYNTLIKASLANSEPEGLQDAMTYYRDMLDRRVRAGDETWWILLTGLLRRGELGLGQEVVSQMRQSKRDVLPGSLQKLVDRLSTSSSSRRAKPYF